MVTLLYLLLTTLVHLSWTVNGSPAYYDSDSSRHTDHFLVDNLKEAYKFMFHKETTTVTQNNSYELTKPDFFNKFCDIVNGEFIRNKTRWQELEDLTYPSEEEDEEEKVIDDVVTLDPHLMRINPDLARRAKATAEQYRRLNKLAQQEMVSRKNQKTFSSTRHMAPTSRDSEELSEESVQSDEGGVLGKMGNEFMGGLFHTFHKTFVKAAQAAAGDQDANVQETFKADLARKAKQTGDHLKTGLGTVKDKVVEGMSKVAGIVGRKIGQLFANYQHGRHLPKE